MEMAKYILSILRTNLTIFWSWGSSDFNAIENGLKFKANGFIHRSWVVIKYNEGSDLFDVFLYSSTMTLVKDFEGIYIDMLVEVIDMNVERANNYDDLVKSKYSQL